MCLQPSSHLTPNSPVGAGVMTVPILPMRMLRPREGEEPAQGHTASSGEADGGGGLKPAPELFHSSLLLLTSELLTPGLLQGEDPLAPGTPPVLTPPSPSKKPQFQQMGRPLSLKGLGFLCPLRSSALWKGLVSLPTTGRSTVKPAQLRFLQASWVSAISSSPQLLESSLILS